MSKPATREGYSNEHTLDCERVLVTLLRGLGPWKKSVFLVGGLVPRYIVGATPPDVPPHAGTQDVDIVIDVQILADTGAYHTLEENLKKLRFERAEKDAHDLLYCIEHAPDGVDAVATLFAAALRSKHGAVVQSALETLKRHFITETVIEGYRKDGPVAVAKFELGDADEPEIREARVLRQREAASVIESLLGRIKARGPPLN